MKNMALSDKRKQRVRRKLGKRQGSRVRLSVFCSGKHVYAQLIDDKQGVTLASASSLDKSLKLVASNIKTAEKIGEEIAKRGKKAGITKVIFDRGHYLYHGRVKALADQARKIGLEF